MSASIHDEPIPPVDEVARQFIAWLEDRGAVFSWRSDSTDDWWLDLNGVGDMTQVEASEIAEAAFDLRGPIRVVLAGRRDAAGLHVH